MASISTNESGYRRLMFVDATGTRRTVYLGRITAKAANVVKAKVEAILEAQITGHSLSKEEAEWVGGIGEDLHAKLAAAGLLCASLRSRGCGRCFCRGLARRGVTAPLGFLPCICSTRCHSSSCCGDSACWGRKLGSIAPTR